MTGFNDEDRVWIKLPKFFCEFCDEKRLDEIIVLGYLGGTGATSFFHLDTIGRSMVVSFDKGHWKNHNFVPNSTYIFKFDVRTPYTPVLLDYNLSKTELSF